MNRCTWFDEILHNLGLLQSVQDFGGDLDRHTDTGQNF